MKKNRATLKEYFKKGAIPTDSNFADLIDSMLIQEEDNISKLPNDPLKIIATGTDEALLNFYRVEQNQEKLTWQLKQKTDGKAGLSIGDETGSRLFVENGSGSVGIGTTSPDAKLRVSGGKIRLDGNQQILFTDVDTSNNLKLQLWSGYGLGVNSSTLFYAANGKHSWRDINGVNERMALTTGANGGLIVKGTGDSSFAGKLGIGTTSPRSALDTGDGVISGAGNDYVKAQFTMSGGGTVTWSGPGQRLKWTQRFIAISMERSVSFSQGYVDIVQPASDIPAGQVYTGSARSATADGVVLNGWEALYAVHTPGGNKDAVSFRIVKYTNDFNAPSNWLLVAVVNGDDSTVRLGTGVILSRSTSSSQGSPIPYGAIIMWYGQISEVPDGWALCDGRNGTPNLKDRFVVGAGGSYAVGNTGGANTVALTVDEMPSHNHNNGDYNVLLQTRSDGKYTSKDTDTTVGEPDLIHDAAIRSAGGNRAHENRPPYYALAYIMKL